MAATYYHITVDEFEEVMADYGAERVDVRGTKEFVYHIPTDKDGLVVRVFSSLTARGARDAGADAIRAFAWSVAADAPLARAVRTHRIDTWEDNLRPKIDALVARIEGGEFDGETPDATLAGLVPAEHDEEGVACVEGVEDTRYGRKAVIAAPAPWETPDGLTPANEAVKATEWDETHRSFDSDRSVWTVDAMALDTVVDALVDAGWEVRGPRMKDPEAFDFGEFIQNAMEHDVLDVTYDTKTSDSVKTIRVEIRLVVPWDEVRVNRLSDGHGMSIREDGLYTDGSHYPFVGSVESVETVAEGI